MISLHHLSTQSHHQCPCVLETKTIVAAQTLNKCGHEPVALNPFTATEALGALVAHRGWKATAALLRHVFDKVRHRLANGEIGTLVPTRGCGFQGNVHPAGHPAALEKT